MPEVHMPDMKAKLQDMNESIKQAKMPNPQEIKDGYLNSNFHKSFHQQLAVRTRVEGEDLQQIREHMTKNKTPAELVSRMPPQKIYIQFALNTSYWHWPRSPGQNFGVFRYFTPEKIFMRSIQTKTPDDIS